jgi:ribosome-binding ATPase
MEISIIGLPGSGKTTVFDALTKCTAEPRPHGGAGLTLCPAVAKVPDARVMKLSTIFHPKKTTLAEIKYVDFAGLPKGFGREQGRQRAASQQPERVRRHTAGGQGVRR